MATITITNPKCKACDKTIYLVDKLTVDNKVYHKACFRCLHYNGPSSLATTTPLKGYYIVGRILISSTSKLAA
ncbi:LIM domain-containing protein WLIM1 [Bienertia sinuspersici]